MYTAETITMAAAAGMRPPKGTDAMAALPEDILVEVFSRVGAIKDLFFFAVTSQWWLHLFTDPAFLRRLCPHLAPRRLLGFLFQPTKFARCERMMRMRTARQRASVSPPTFLPAPGSPLGPAARALTPFVPDDGRAFNYAEPLAARRGVVLMQLVPRTFDLRTMTDDNDQLVVGLCDLSTGERHVAPPLHGTGIRLHVSGYAIVTAADADADLTGDDQPSSGRFTFSQLLLITAPPDKGADHLHLHSYSAAAAAASGWEAPAELLDRRRFGLVGDRSAAVHDGAAHWLCMDHEDDRSLYKLSVPVGTAAPAPRVSSLAKLAGVRVGGTPLLCVSGGGELSVACVYPMHAAVWAQQQAGDGAAPPPPWVRTRVVRIPAAAPNPEDPSYLRQQCRQVWLDFGMGLVVVVYRGGGVFLLDLEKEVVEKVMDSYPRLSGIRPYHIRVDVPYKMGLMDLFLGRLGPRRISRWGLTAA